MRRELVLWILLLVKEALCGTYYFDITNGFGRTFDGVGGISGGGATSKLLPDYNEPQRSDILDFLFKPHYGASMQILKVEIGGDVQSSEGTESSHMHEEWDENYQRGYEWWLMTEAKKRNPKIKLCGLAWGYPGWLSDGSWNPYVYPNKTADYIAKWIVGAKKYYGLDINCIGIWNEKPYKASFIKLLRQVLNDLGLSSVKIVAGDGLPGGAWNIVEDMLKDSEVMDAVDIIGVHYMGSEFNKRAVASNKPIWSSEDWSSDGTEEGGGCMAQILNRNYVYGYYTSTIAWNMLCAYYPRMDYDGHGLMTANEPWSGHYKVGPPIWAMAHTSQFTEPGWKYLRHREGVGELEFGGTYVSLMSEDQKHLTIIVETMDTKGNKFCNRPPAFPRKVFPQTAEFVLKGDMNVTFLHMWSSTLNSNGSSIFFKYAGKVPVSEGRVKVLDLNVNSIYTLTTLDSGQKGKPSVAIPRSERFPVDFYDNYEAYHEYQEAYGFTQQIGAFEVRSTNDSRHKKVMRQVVMTPPIHWCPFPQKTPMGVIGDGEWRDLNVSVDVFVPSVNSTNGIFLGSRVDHGGCSTFTTSGIFFFLSLSRQTASISYDMMLGKVVSATHVEIRRDTWYHLHLSIKENRVEARLNDNFVVLNHILDSKKSPSRGYVSLGCQSFGLADFDNLHIKSFV